MEAERLGDQLPYVPRIAYALYFSRDGNGSKQSTHELLYNLDEKAVVSDTIAQPHLHASIDTGELEIAEAKLLENADFQEAVKRLKLPSGARLVTDPWIYGCDSDEPKPRLTTYCVYYYRNENPDGNYYANPLPLMPVMDM